MLSPNSIRNVVLFTLISVVISDANSDGLPFCRHLEDNRQATNLFLVSTLDGHLTALEANNGNKKWRISTGKPLLSSNIHHLELTSEGQWARLVPSLSGALYKLAGDSLQLLPLNADHLLSSSYKYSDDLVIAGGREISSFGIDALSGRILWQCELRGCTEYDDVTAGDGSGGKENSELLLLRRTAHTVRALETKTGQERWNFSVGEHDVNLSENNTPACSSSENDMLSSPLLKIIMPDGLVKAHNPHFPENLLWQYKLESPITGAWHMIHGKLQTVNVLNVGFGQMSSTNPGPTQKPNTPSVYIGVHNSQLYIQESPTYREEANAAISKPNAGKQKALKWHSRPAISSSIDDSDSSDTALVDINNNNDLKESPSKALQTLYSSKPAESAGVFLFGVDEDDDLCDSNIHIDYEEAGDNVTENILGITEIYDQPEMQILYVSLWFYWKEVLVIAVSSALLLNLVVTQRALFRPTVITPSEVIKQEYIVVERHVEVPAPVPKSSDYSSSLSSDSSGSGPYSSRYESDFTPLRCLGRGGFGVVFEAKNNIDDCSYAVKRITLPNRKSQRDRVMREVRALAKLEHPHIVRYFNAWLEQPPSGWQEEKDKDLFKEFNITSQALNSQYTSTNITSTANQRNFAPVQHPSVLNLKRESHEISIDNCFDALKYNYISAAKAARSRSFSCNDSFSIIFDDQYITEDSSVKCTMDNSISEDVCSDGCPKTGILKELTNNDDSFIVFANSKRGQSNDSVISITEIEKENQKQRKKKGHRRHWSLDMSAAPSTSTVNSGRIYLYIQMQLCQPESLHDWLRQNKQLEGRKMQVAPFFSQIVAAVEYVHLAGLIHRDLKPSNIFFAPDGSVKVGDFGLVTEMSGKQNNHMQQQSPTTQQQVWDWKHTHRVGTQLYMSPEQAAGALYSFKVDIFSLGLILFELLFPFSTESERVASLLHLREGNFPSSFIDEHPKEHELLQLMLSHDPACRPTAEGVRKNSWYLFESHSSPHEMKHGS